MHVVAGPASGAVSAGDGRVHDDRIADGQVLDRRSDRVHPAAVLVAEGEGQAGVERRIQLAVQDVHIGPADTGAGCPDDDTGASRSASGTVAGTRVARRFAG